MARSKKRNIKRPAKANPKTKRPAKVKSRAPVSSVREQIQEQPKATAPTEPIIVNPSFIPDVIGLAGLDYLGELPEEVFVYNLSLAPFGDESKLEGGVEVAFYQGNSLIVVVVAPSGYGTFLIGFTEVYGGALGKAKHSRTGEVSGDEEVVALYEKILAMFKPKPGIELPEVTLTLSVIMENPAEIQATTTSVFDEGPNGEESEIEQRLRFQ